MSGTIPRWRIDYRLIQLTTSNRREVSVRHCILPAASGQDAAFIFATNRPDTKTTLRRIISIRHVIEKDEKDNSLNQ
jgi:hypothetical protein